MGLMDNAFAVLCEGLGSNSCLQILDLRNNQISHQGAAELAAALKRNPHLKALGNSQNIFVHIIPFIYANVNLMLLVANLVNTKCYKKPGK